ncbi:MAG TPA: ABC transporter permease, partial [Alcaligenes faecalis]
MGYEFWIGARYAGLAKGRKRRGGRKDRFVSFIAGSSMAGIALGVAALIVVLSVMNGFQTQVRDRMLSVLPHIELIVRNADHQQVLNEWKSLAQKAQTNPAVVGSAPYVAGQGMLVRSNQLMGVQVRGIEPDQESKVSELAQQMVMGRLENLQPGTFGIVLGEQLANQLRVSTGDTIMLMAPQGSISPAGFSPRMRQFTVTGVFSSGYYEYDASLAFVNVDDASKIFRDSGNSGVRLRIKDMQQA